jgi:hypothetical protein
MPRSRRRISSTVCLLSVVGSRTAMKPSSLPSLRRGAMARSGQERPSGGGMIAVASSAVTRKGPERSPTTARTAAVGMEIDSTGSSVGSAS